ncbi:regulatory protein RecX [Lysobacter humi (ex Lee et al. 2017)]
MTPVQRAIGLLSRREHSRKELTRKLSAKGIETDEVMAAVGKLADAGWQDERRFAESLVRARASSGYGPLHIRAELATHDLPAEIRQDVLESFDGDWLEIARDQVARRFARIEDARLRARKAGDYLVRRGFPGDIVRAASRPDADD